MARAKPELRSFELTLYREILRVLLRSDTARANPEFLYVQSIGQTDETDSVRIASHLCYKLSAVLMALGPTLRALFPRTRFRNV